MVYKGKKKYSKKYGKKSTKYKAFNKKVKEIAKGVVNSHTEKKFYDQGLAGTVSNTGSFYELTQIIEKGDAFRQREGSNVYLKKVEVRYTLWPGDNYNMVRILIVSTRDDTTPVNAYQFFKSADAGASSTTSAILGFVDSSLVDSRTYRVLYDKTHLVNYQDGTEDIPNKVVTKQHLEFNIYKKLKFLGDTGSAKNERIYWVAISDSAAVLHPDLDVTIRLKFADVI